MDSFSPPPAITGPRSHSATSCTRTCCSHTHTLISPNPIPLNGNAINSDFRARWGAVECDVVESTAPKTTPSLGILFVKMNIPRAPQTKLSNPGPTSCLEKHKYNDIHDYKKETRTHKQVITIELKKKRENANAIKTTSDESHRRVFGLRTSRHKNTTTTNAQ